MRPEAAPETGELQQPWVGESHDDLLLEFLYLS